MRLEPLGGSEPTRTLVEGATRKYDIFMLKINDSQEKRFERSQHENPYFKELSAQYVDMVWARLLHPSEIEIVKHIWYRTIRFAKHSEKISRQGFLSGNFPEEAYGDDGATFPCIITKTTFYRAMSALKKFQVVIENPRGTYRLNFKASIATIMKARKPSGAIIDYLNHPHASRIINNVQENGIGMGNPEYITDSHLHGTNYSHLDGTHKRELKEKVINTPSQATVLSSGDKSIMFEKKICTKKIQPRSFDTAAEALAHASGQKKTVETKRKKRGTLPDLCALFEDAWLAAIANRDQTLPRYVFNQRQVRNLKLKIIKPLQHTEIDFQDLATYIVQHWVEIKGLYFKKSSSYPDSPAISWVIACSETYVSAYQSKCKQTAPVERGTDLVTENEKLRQRNAVLEELAGKAIEAVKAQKAENKKRRLKPKIKRTKSVTEAFDDYDKRLLGK